MHRHVVFTLFAPLGAWGAPNLSAANAAIKHTEFTPTRSALVGLIGAALGISRSGIPDLSAEVRFAYRTDIHPRLQPKPDYQTITQGRVPRSGADTWTRHEEIRAAELAGVEGSILSKREFFDTGLWTVSVHLKGPRHTPEALVDALASPVFIPSVGRRAFTLGLPADPAIIDGSGPVEAIGAYGLPWTRHPDLKNPWLAPLVQLWQSQGLGDRRPLCWDDGYPGAPAWDRSVERRDEPRILAHDDGVIVRTFLVRTERQASVAWPSQGA